VRSSFLKIDWGLLIPAIVLVFLGLSGIFSINLSLFRSQVVFFAVSLLGFVFFSQANLYNFKNYSLSIYIGSILILFIVILLGVESRGSVRWIDFLGFRAQFSEILKPFLMLSLAVFISEKSGRSFKIFFTILALLFPIFFLIFLQPDLGNALIYFFTVLLTLFAFAFPLRYFIFSALTSVLFFPLLWTFLKDYQKERLLIFFKFRVDPLGSSYNAIQSIIAVGSGMFLGKGLGQGTQSLLRFLPERHTDFIFATLSEELGFVGGLIIVLTFSFLLYRIIVISNDSDDMFLRIFAVCSFFLLSTEFLTNVGMNIGLMPIVGVSLPFVSYGGSSLLSNFILLGFLSSISKKFERKEVLEIK